MAKIVLDRPGVPPIVGQLVAARVTQHMAADLERGTTTAAATSASMKRSIAIHSTATDGRSTSIC